MAACTAEFAAFIRVTIYRLNIPGGGRTVVQVGLCASRAQAELLQQSLVRVCGQPRGWGTACPMPILAV